MEFSILALYEIYMYCCHASIDHTSLMNHSAVVAEQKFQIWEHHGKGRKV